MTSLLPLFQAYLAQQTGTQSPQIEALSPQEKGPVGQGSTLSSGEASGPTACCSSQGLAQSAPAITLEQLKAAPAPKQKHRVMERVYCNRFFSVAEMEAIRGLIAQNPSFHRTKIARAVCEMLPWYRENGELKSVTCSVALKRMHDDGLITLPPPTRDRSTYSKPSFPATAATDPEPVETRPVHQLPALELRSPLKGAQSHLWNEYIERYHYLGFNLMAGAQMRFFVFSGDRLVALISFGASAWKLADRESFIGWSEQARQRNLQLVVNNARFLVLPWIQSKGLASKILAMCARALPALWQARYGYRPVLLETFVETPRHKGTCYKAANWVHVGQTVGRGKKCPVMTAILPIKDIWLYPLAKNFRAVLCANPQTF